jgi:hypothetical protein
MTSAYPRTIDALMVDARRLAAELGRTPSRNQLMTTLRIGRDKARAVLARLADDSRDTHTVPAEADPSVPNHPESGSTRHLRVVPATRPDHDAVLADSAADGGVTLPTELSDDDAASGISAQVTDASAPAPNITTDGLVGWLTRQRGSAPARRPAQSWPLVLLALPAFVAIWSGWVGLGSLTGFGPVHPLPGIADGFTLNTAITLPIGVETYAAYALRIWLAGIGSTRARRFAKWSAIGSLVLGAAGQVAYHLMTARHLTAAPWPITTAVACLPVIVLGCGAALAHLQHTTDRTENS